MSDRKITGVVPWFKTEVTNALFLLSGATITLDGTKATVSLASHLLSSGDYTTFSGVTGVTALNDSTWGPITKVNANSYTFPCTLTGSPAGTIVQEKLYFFPAGDWNVNLGANGAVEYNPNNGWLTAYPTSTAGGDTWRTLIAASGSGAFTTDGYSIRFRENGTTATSYFSQSE